MFRNRFSPEDFPPLENFEQDGPQESRLWENDSSYLIAASPHMYENNRIRLKLILGYRIQSTVHGLPPPNDMYSTYPSFDRRLLPQTRNSSRYGNLSPEEFDALPEHQQRRILREQYTQNQQFGGYQEPIGIQGREGNMQNLALWAVKNFDRIGWKSILGIIVFLGGIYRGVR